MNLKTTYRLLGGFALLCIFASCSTSYQTASNFGSRKYTKGYFYNGRGSVDNVVARNNTPALPKTQAVSNTAIEEKNQSSTALTIATNTTTKVTPAIVENSKATASQVNAKKVSGEIGLNPVLPNNNASNVTVEDPNGSSSFSNAKYTPGLESVSATQSRHSNSDGGFFDFKHHAVRTVLLIILALLIIGLLIVALANGDATVTAS